MSPFCLQNIVLQTDDEASKSLYTIKEEGFISTATYMNYLNLELLKELIDLEKVFLRFNYSGAGTLEVRGVNLKSNKDFLVKAIKLGEGVVTPAISDTNDSNDSGNQSASVFGLSASSENSLIEIDLSELLSDEAIPKNKEDEKASLIYIRFSSSLKLTNAQYFIASKNEVRDVKVALISTTHNRFDDIKALVNNFIAFANDEAKEVISDDSCSINFRDPYHLFIVNNGSSFKLDDLLGFEVGADASRNHHNLTDKVINSLNDKLTLIQSPINSGGAGGFALGLEEVLKFNKDNPNESFTHYLFIDDDAYFNKECLFRTIRLLSCLKDKYQQSVLSGSMFTKEDPTHCHCMLEGLRNNLHHKMIAGRFKVTDKNTLLENLSTAYQTITSNLVDAEESNSSLRTTYAAWWYACYPIEIAQEFGGPNKGYFLRGDDQEYALRINKKVIYFNGICVWHPRFSTKVSGFRTFLGMRNYMVNCLKYSDSPRKLILILVCYKFYKGLFQKDKTILLSRLYAINSFREFKNEYICGDRFIGKYQEYVTGANEKSILVIYILVFLKLAWLISSSVFRKVY